MSLRECICQHNVDVKFLLLNKHRCRRQIVPVRTGKRLHQTFKPNVSFKQDDACFLTSQYMQDVAKVFKIYLATRGRGAGQTTMAWCLGKSLEIHSLLHVSGACMQILH